MLVALRSVLLVLLVTPSVISVAGCSSLVKQVLKEPKVNLEKVDVREVGASGATVVFNVGVENPNGVGITLDALKYDVEIAGKALSSGALEKPAEVAAHGKTVVEIPVPLKYSEVFSSLMGFLKAGESTYRVKGEAAFGIFSIPFDQAGKFKLRE